MATPRESFGDRETGRRAFTLIELLVVMAIISLLVSILVPSLKKAQKLAKAAVCLSNMHHVGAVLSLYAQDWRGFLPPVCTNPWSGPPPIRWQQMLFQKRLATSQDMFICPSVRPMKFKDANTNPIYAGWDPYFMAVGMRSTATFDYSTNIDRCTYLETTNVYGTEATYSRPGDFFLVTDSFNVTQNFQWYYVQAASGWPFWIDPRHSKKAHTLFADMSVRPADKAYFASVKMSNGKSEGWDKFVKAPTD